MLFPKKVKHRKWQRGRINEKYRNRPATRGITLSYGSFGLKATTQARVRSHQIEAARKTIVRTIGKTGKVWIRIFPDRPYTAKPPEVGMGKGKGDVQGFECDVQPGRMLFEVDGATEETCQEALRKASAKLPLKAKVVQRGE